MYLSRNSEVRNKINEAASKDQWPVEVAKIWHSEIEKNTKVIWYFGTACYCAMKNDYGLMKIALNQ